MQPPRAVSAARRASCVGGYLDDLRKEFQPCTIGDLPSLTANLIPQSSFGDLPCFAARRLTPRSLLAFLLLLSCPLVLRADDPKPVPKDAEPTGPDYAVQGEYVGEVFTQAGNSPIGVQVVALGKGKFRATGYIGGLPGEGWDRSPRKSSEGELKDGVVEIKSDDYSSTIKNGMLTISVAGVKISELKKIDRESRTLGEPPPDGAVVLFDGSTASNFENGKMTEDGLLMPGCTSKEKFGSGKLHLEFRLPFMPDARDQARGNSGVYVQGRYEVQVLDSFGLDEADNGCGAIYSMKAPIKTFAFRRVPGRPMTSTSRLPSTPMARRSRTRSST